MPRLPRLLLSQSFYHVMTRGNNKNKVFRNDTDYQKYLDFVFELKVKHNFEIFHYCLMPNHTHFLVKINKMSDFSTFMKKLNLKYFYYFKKKYGWVGHFWQDRFKSQPVGKDSYFIQCGKYIELNPVRSGIVKDPNDYNYSSFKHYAKGNSNKIITTDMIYQQIGKTSEERQERYNEMLIAEAVLESYKKRAWGSESERYNENRKIKYNLKV